jgi:hypothetical protein
MERNAWLGYIGLHYDDSELEVISTILKSRMQEYCLIQDTVHITCNGIEMSFFKENNIDLFNIDIGNITYGQ